MGSNLKSLLAYLFLKFGFLLFHDDSEPLMLLWVDRIYFHITQKVLKNVCLKFWFFLKFSFCEFFRKKTKLKKSRFYISSIQPKIKMRLLVRIYYNSFWSIFGSWTSVYYSPNKKIEFRFYATAPYFRHIGENMRITGV